jgi:hypothetical protein
MVRLISSSWLGIVIKSARTERAMAEDELLTQGAEEQACSMIATMSALREMALKL